MNKRQHVKWKMLSSVMHFAKQHHHELSAIPAWSNSFEKFVQMMEQLALVIDAQSITSRGYTLMKKRFWEELALTGEELSAALCAILSDKGNAQELESVRFRLYELQGGSASQAHVRFRTMMNTAASLKNELLEYGWSEARLNDYVQRVGDFETILISPRSAIAKRKVETHFLAELMKAIEKHIEIYLDSCVLQLRTENPFVLSMWKNIRVTPKVRKRKKKHAHAESIEVNRTEEQSIEHIEELPPLEVDRSELLRVLKPDREESTKVYSLELFKRVFGKRSG